MRVRNTITITRTFCLRNTSRWSRIPVHTIRTMTTIDTILVAFRTHHNVLAGSWTGTSTFFVHHIALTCDGCKWSEWLLKSWKSLFWVSFSAFLLQLLYSHDHAPRHLSYVSWNWQIFTFLTKIHIFQKEVEYAWQLSIISVMQSANSPPKDELLSELQIEKLDDRILFVSRQWLIYRVGQNKTSNFEMKPFVKFSSVSIQICTVFFWLSPRSCVRK